MSTREWLLLGLLGSLGVYAWQRGVFFSSSGQGSAALPDGMQDSTPVPTTQPIPSGNILTSTIDSAEALLSSWQSPPSNFAYLFAQAESKYGIPNNILQKMGYLESHWRNDIITGAKKSPSGAVGVMQFLPSTAASLGIDPLNPAQAIDGAGKYLAQLYNRFKDWTAATAAYNWGQGNVNKAITAYAENWLNAAPTETKNYVAFAAPAGSFA